MAPLVRRSWSAIGKPPTLYQMGARAKVSIAAAIWISSRTCRLGMYFETIANGYYNSEASAQFLNSVLRRLNGTVIVLWDGGNMHKGGPIKSMTERYRERLSIERLPPYAPMLNPVEPMWIWLKYGKLSNHGAHTTAQLNDMIDSELLPVMSNQKMLRGFVGASRLKHIQID